MADQLPFEDEFLEVLRNLNIALRVLDGCDVEDRFAAQIRQMLGQLGTGGIRHYLERVLLAELLDDARWRGLTDKPSQFSTELAAVLNRIRGYMKAQYSIEGHHPTRNERRDAHISVLRSRGYKFEAIGAELGIPANTAQRGYERHEERMHQLIKSLEKIVDFFRRHNLLPVYAAAVEATQAHPSDRTPGHST